MKRIYVLISGRVQGVFYRAFIMERAQILKLTGWIRNLSDGRVEALFDGKDADVEAILEYCKKGPPHANVKEVDYREETPAEEFPDFRIIY